jgi:hypothetical protein
VLIVGLADIHGDMRQLSSMAAELGAADLVVLTGDLTQFGSADVARRIVENVRRAGARQVLGVHGNCDPKSVVECLIEDGVSIHAKVVTVGPVALLGLGGSLPCPGETPTELSEAEIEDTLKATAHDLDPAVPFVLVSHQPPFGTETDKAQKTRHVGSHAVRAFILERKPVACLTGHIHESAGTDTLGACRVINPGPLREGKYAYLSIDGGSVVAEIRRTSA